MRLLGDPVDVVKPVHWTMMKRFAGTDFHLTPDLVATLDEAEGAQPLCLYADLGDVHDHAQNVAAIKPSPASLADFAKISKKID